MTEGKEKKTPENMSLKEKFSKEKDKFMKMDGVTRKIYFRDYYLLPLLLILCVIGAFVWFGRDLFASKKIIYSGATVGFDLSDEGENYLTKGFIKYLGKGYKKNKASVARNVLMKTYEEAKYNDMSMELIFTSQVSVGMYQYAMFTADELEHYENYDFYLDLSDMKAEEKYKDLDYYINPEGHVYGIRLPENVLEKMGCPDMEIYLCFVYLEKPTELNPSFVDYLFFS
ncbi:MAG: hypothetical protein J6Y08_10040 [Clostridiales bacterium]|nr:hypothetical protein [Clostridiales bacterium]